MAMMIEALEGAGFEVRDVESLREHYGMTLRAWVANLEAGVGRGGAADQRGACQGSGGSTWPVRRWPLKATASASTKCLRSDRGRVARAACRAREPPCSTNAGSRSGVLVDICLRVLVVLVDATPGWMRVIEAQPLHREPVPKLGR